MSFNDLIPVTAGEYYGFHALCPLLNVIGVENFSRRFQSSYDYVTNKYASKIVGVTYELIS